MFNTTRNGFRDPRPLLPVQRAAHIHMDAAWPGSLKVPRENPGEVTSAVAPTQEPWRFELPGSCCSASLALPHNTIAFCCVCARHGLWGDHCPLPHIVRTASHPAHSLLQWCLQLITSLPGQGFRTDLEGWCHWQTHWMTFWGDSSFLGLPPKYQPSWTLKGSHALVLCRWDAQLQLILGVATVTKAVI